jgi:hypothetical protein
VPSQKDASNGFFKGVANDNDYKTITPAKKPSRPIIDAPRTPGNVKAAFDALRPATASSGIGGIIDEDKFSTMGKTVYAGAGSPIKTTKQANAKKWMNKTGIRKPGDFYPKAPGAESNGNASGPGSPAKLSSGKIPISNKKPSKVSIKKDDSLSGTFGASTGLQRERTGTLDRAVDENLGDDFDDRTDYL